MGKDSYLKSLTGVKSMSKKAYYQGDEDWASESSPRDLSKEYNFMDRFGSTSKMANLFNMMADACSTNTWMFMQLDATQEMLGNYFKCLALKKRYAELVVMSDNILHYDEEGFHLHEHVFETMDEVEKALKNKAFL